MREPQLEVVQLALVVAQLGASVHRGSDEVALGALPPACAIYTASGS